MKTTHLLRTLLASLALAPLAAALDITYVADTTDDRIYRLRDTNLDGDYDDAGEVGTFYASALGGLPMTSPNGLVVRPDGGVLVCDSNVDQVLLLRDLNLDGDALDVGEAQVFFDGTVGGNASGIQMVSANGVALDASGRVWVASNNQILGSVVGDDMILVLEDLNADGDANDSGEARVFHAPALGSGSVGDSIPTAVKIGLDGAVYYAENGVTGVVAKAIWRLADLNNSGAIDAPGEAQAFFALPPQPSNIFLWDVEQGADGAWYVSDRGNEILWRGLDANSNGSISGAEAVAWFTGSSPSDLWTVRFASDGSILGCEAAGADRIRRFADADSNGVVDTLEVADVYNDTVAAFDIANPRSIALAPDLAPPTRYCTAGTSTSGCVATLSWGGFPSASATSGFTLTASSLEGDKQSLFFYGLNGRSAAPWGSGSSFLCVKAPTQRTAVANSGGTAGSCAGTLTLDWLAFIAANPTALGVPFSVGDVIQAQVWYRDPPSAKTTNLTDALEFTLAP